MAQKRIKLVQQNIVTDKLRILYDDGTQGEIQITPDKLIGFTRPESLIGLTLKQAKMFLGIKN